MVLSDLFKLFKKTEVVSTGGAKKKATSQEAADEALKKLFNKHLRKCH